MSTENPRSGDPASDSPSSLGAEFTMTVPCADLDRSMAELRSVGFRLDEIGPADAPSYAVMVRDPTVLRLDRTAFMEGERQPFLRVPCDPDELNLGADTRSWLRGPAPLEQPVMEPSFTVSHAGVDGRHLGRAGMHYRDLVPDRWGGAVIASHITIAEGGPVPDYVHYHRVAFQLIFCHRGWVRVVYEDQGEPFVLHPGDAVLQAPGIRHRVLESSPGCQVVEISSPALHPTMLDHDLELPNGSNPGRRYGGQDFVHHRHDRSQPVPLAGGTLAARDLGLFFAANHRFHGYVIELGAGGHINDASPVSVLVDELCRVHGRSRHPFTLLFMLDGSATITDDGRSVMLATDDSAAIPADMTPTVAFGPDFERALILTGTPAGTESP